jgi:hypothetical protein
MSVNAFYAFILNSELDWKISTPEDWDWDVVELEGTEKVMGHHRIDGSVYKVIQTSDGTTIAVAK